MPASDYSLHESLNEPIPATTAGELHATVLAFPPGSVPLHRCPIISPDWPFCRFPGSPF